MLDNFLGVIKPNRQKMNIVSQATGMMYKVVLPVQDLKNCLYLNQMSVFKTATEVYILKSYPLLTLLK